jgi:phenylacetic acid degradation operon negative regulatory protein
LLDRLRQQKLLEQMGRGRAAEFRITDLGRRRVRVHRPADQWGRPWDGKWRAFLFDLPVQRRRDRLVLWRALRDAKLGLLQRSVWIWPHEVEPFLMEVIEAHGIPECFCGFEVSRLFLCDNAEAVATAWDCDEIAQAHETYLQHAVANVSSLDAAEDLGRLARIARVERDAYQYAFALDPLLPRLLWPKGYKGPRVEQRHQAFRARLAARALELR